jgi:hypothetical protein
MAPQLPQGRNLLPPSPPPFHLLASSFCGVLHDQLQTPLQHRFPYQVRVANTAGTAPHSGICALLAVTQRGLHALSVPPHSCGVLQLILSLQPGLCDASKFLERSPQEAILLVVHEQLQRLELVVCRLPAAKSFQQLHSFSRLPQRPVDLLVTRATIAAADNHNTHTLASTATICFAARCRANARFHTADQ